MKKLMKNTLSTAVAASVASLLAAGSVQAVEYEVWAPDQSNSTAATALGSDGGYINIWDGELVNDYFVNQAPSATPLTYLGCNRTDPANPATALHGGGAIGCDVHDVFPGGIGGFVAVNPGNSDDGDTLDFLGGKSRVHGMIPDPQSLYFNVNFFSNGAGYVGIMDGRSKEAVALFRVTHTHAAGNGKSVHMSFWNADGSALIVANLHGKAIERIKMDRDKDGNITKATFERDATLLFTAQPAAFNEVTDTAIYFEGTNGAGRTIGGAGSTAGGGGGVESAVTGSYDLTPGGAFSGYYTASNGESYCMETNCGLVALGAPNPVHEVVGRKEPGESSNVVVCPIVTSNNKVMVTFGGGGLIVADADTYPMTVVGGYKNDVINGAGCGGSEIGGDVYLNAGTNAAGGLGGGGAGSEKSTFGVYKLNIATFQNGNPGGNTPHTENLPAPAEFAFDQLNTQGFGNTTGFGGSLTGNGTVFTKTSGQDPTLLNPANPATYIGRRDSHGMTTTVTGSFVHVADRIKNTITSVGTAGGAVKEYPITGPGNDGCAVGSVGNGVTAGDPAGDLMATGPNNDVLFIALRGPVPVTVGHAAQGSCPGVGIIVLDKQEDDGNPATIEGLPDQVGYMTHVMRTVNTVDQTPAHNYAGTPTTSGAASGETYTGLERSDIHGVAVRVKGPGG